MANDELCAGGHGCHNGRHACDDGLACLRCCDGWHDCSHAWVAHLPCGDLAASSAGGENDGFHRAYRAVVSTSAGSYRGGSCERPRTRVGEAPPPPNARMFVEDEDRAVRGMRQQLKRQSQCVAAVIITGWLLCAMINPPELRAMALRTTSVRSGHTLRSRRGLQHSAVECTDGSIHGGELRRWEGGRQNVVQNTSSHSE